MLQQVRTCRKCGLYNFHPNLGLFSVEDLWDCLEEASGKPIAAVMGSWTKQMGFPIIVVDQEQVRVSIKNEICF